MQLRIERHSRICFTSLMEQSPGNGGCPILFLARPVDDEVGQQFECAHHGRMIRFGKPVGDAGIKKFLTRRGIRQGNTECLCAFQGEAQILLVEFDPKSGREVPLEQSFAVDLQNTGGRKTTHERSAHP